MSHFCENAANRPYVNGSAILFLAEEDLRSSVPESNNFMSVGFHWEAKGSCKTEVSKLDVAVLIDKKVLRLQVSVHDSVGMAVGCSLEDLVSKFLYFLRWERAAHLSHVLFQIVFTVFKNQVEFVLRVDDFLQSIKMIT